jgi:FMN-dependent dehydrogenase
MAAEAVCLADFETIAQQRLTPEVYAFISGGAADELTVRWNQEALERVRLRSRVLVDVSQVDTRLTLFGQSLSCPILLAQRHCTAWSIQTVRWRPCGGQEMQKLSPRAQHYTQVTKVL